MNPSVMVVDDPLIRRAARALVPRQAQALQGQQVVRLRLMYAALKAGLDLDLSVTSWPELAPLKRGGKGRPNEVQGVLKERARLAALPEAERAAELLFLAGKLGGTR